MRKATAPIAATLILLLCAAQSGADVMDSVNETRATAAGNYWAATEVGWFYTPSVSYNLTGIDTRFGEVDGRTVTLEFFENGPRSVSGSVLLGSAAFVPTTSWAGGAFSSAISLTAGTTYFVGFRGTQSMAPGLLGVNCTDYGSATQLTYRFGWTGTGQYEMSYQSSPYNQPILRFNGTPPDVVPEAGTLTALMGLLSGGGLLMLRRKR